MKTLSAPINTQKDASQAGWCEVYDLYLKEAITTPFGTTDVIRITDLPGGLSFFTPTIDPEPGGTQGDAADYLEWPLKRGAVKADSKNGDTKVTFAASNVSTEWAQMLADVDWYDTPVVIRKVSTSIAAPTANDCAVLFSGLIDSAILTNEQLQFSCSNSMASLSTIAPRENMHQNCRFGWADDLCTAIRFLAENYKAKTCGVGSTTTLVKSADLTEDAGSSAAYGTDIVNALADVAISASSEKGAYSGVSVAPDHVADWFRLVDHGFANDEPFTFGGAVAPSGITFGTTYYVEVVTRDYFRALLTPSGLRVTFTSNGSGVTLSTPTDYGGKQIKSGNSGYWQLLNNNDWGTLSNGYWQIPDAQAGIANAALKPYLQFDFGSAKTPRLWRLMSVEGSTRLEDLVRLVQFFSSSDAATWTFEGYFEMPPVGGTLFDCLIPKASTKRYWRICVRSRWATSFSPKLLAEVQAYENGRHWWKNGTLTFDSNTATAALRGLSRKVMASYSGECLVAKLPVAPASGDTFVIERGCGRSFNECAERRNTENFGGFTDLPNQTIIR